jgi:hypothetical protein
MKKIIIVFMALTTTLVSMTLIADLYIKSQIDFFIDETCSYRYDPYVWQCVDGERVKDDDNKTFYQEDIVAPLRIFSLLNSSKWSLLETGENGEYNSYGSKNPGWHRYIQWKSVIESNPELAYQALEIYGDYIVKQITSQMGYQYEHGNFKKYMLEDFSDNRNPNWFTEKRFWNANKKSIKQYQILIEELLKLNDKDLNYFIETNDVSDAASYGFNSWLEKKGLIKDDGKVPNYAKRSANSSWRYPGDLLCLTKRVMVRNPEWTPRKFLTEAKKFSNEVLKVIEENN